MKTVQYFTPEYLEQCKNATPVQIVEFLEDFKRLHLPLEERSKLISVKVPNSLLKAFRAKAEIAGVRYQTQLKKLMLKWVSE